MRRQLACFFIYPLVLLYLFFPWDQSRRIRIATAAALAAVVPIASVLDAAGVIRLPEDPAASPVVVTARVDDVGGSDVSVAPDRQIDVDGLQRTESRPATAASESAVSEATEQPVLYPDRADHQEYDVEAVVGHHVLVDGMSVAVTGVDPLKNAPVLTITVELRNASDSRQRVRPRFWHLQTPAGRVLDRVVPRNRRMGEFVNGELVPDGVITAELYFIIDEEVGDFYVLYEPSSEERGVWQIRVG